MRISNGWTFKPYALLDLEYGRFTNIKEDKGTMKLDVKANDYYSVKPAIGAEISYKVKFARYSTFNLSLGGKYEQELGEIQDIDLLTYKTFLSGGIRKQVKELATICDRLKKELTKDPTIGNEMQQDADLIDDTYSIKQLLLAVGEMTESQFQSLLQYAHKIKEK